MRKFVLVIVVMALLGCGAVLGWWITHPAHAATELLLYGNVDLRQVQLAFNNSERIADVMAKEGDRVRKGDALARLDTSRLEPTVAQAEAQVAAQYQVFKRLDKGSRPEEIAQAKANFEAAEADAANARRQFQRLKKLASVRLSDQTTVQAVSKEDIDNAAAALDVAEAKLTVNEKALRLAQLGPRQEDKDEAEARLNANKAQLAFLKQQLTDAVLLAPDDAVVRTRLMEPGEMASPMKAVFSLAKITPKWVRAYVSEPDRGKVTDKMKAEITVDSFPNRRFDGWVGYISSVAEFTPKSVQTEELRTSLVYEVRVFVNDPEEKLCLGMPATIHLSLESEKRTERRTEK